jgi:hypothetical protein
MSKNLDYLKAYFDKVQADGLDPEYSSKWTETHFSDDFQLLDENGKPTMDKATYLGFSRTLLSSFKDMKFVVDDISENSEGVKVTNHWEGTFSGDLDLSAMGMGVIHANGKKIVWPESTGIWKVDGELVKSIQNTAGGSVAEFFAPLGVQIPSA